MASVRLKIKTSQTLKDYSHPIILQVLKDGKKAISTLNVSCNIQDWDTAINLPRNRRLSIICQKGLLKMEELLFEGIDKNWSAKKIVNIFSGKDTKELMFFKYKSEIDFDDENKTPTRLINETRLRKFKKFLKGKDIPMGEITYELLKEYKKYMEDQGLKSTDQYLLAVRKIYNYAVENDDFIPSKNVFKKSLLATRKGSSTINRNLDLEQIREFFRIEYDDSNEKLYRIMAIDFWRFCFLMRGINLIEMAVMKPEDIRGDYFEFTREKLKNRVSAKQRIRIMPEARVIINKYLGPEKDYVFPILKNGFDKDKNAQDYKFYQTRLTLLNYHLQKIGEKLSLDFNMSTMSARYSFVNLAKLHEVPFLYLQELIGHKTKSTTDIYLDVFPQSKIDEYHRKVIDLVL
jgi:site-specific recombinase XerD